MVSHRSFSWLVVPLLGGCVSGGPREPPPVAYSAGFFADFDRMVERVMSSGSPEAQASTLDVEFARRVEDGPGPTELVALGSTWDKVEAFLSLGRLSAEVMAPIEGAAQSRVDILGDAAGWVLRSDAAAVAAWNGAIAYGNFGDVERMRPTGEILWESLYLVLTQSARASRDVWVERGAWVDGSWIRTRGFSKDLWVNGFYETLWQEGPCHEEYVGTECVTYYVEASCYDVWIDDGYWESSCSAYDEDDNCVEWSEAWVSTGYYETQCDPAYSYEECTDLYETYCEPARWVDVWTPGHVVEEAYIPGQLAWVEGHLSETSGYRTVALPAEEAEILRAGITFVASYGAERVGAACYTRLDAAMGKAAGSAPEGAARMYREAILGCLSKGE